MVSGGWWSFMFVLKFFVLLLSYFLLIHDSPGFMCLCLVLHCFFTHTTQYWLYLLVNCKCCEIFQITEIAKYFFLLRNTFLLLTLLWIAEMMHNTRTLMWNYWILMQLGMYSILLHPSLERGLYMVYLRSPLTMWRWLLSNIDIIKCHSSMIFGHVYCLCIILVHGHLLVNYPSKSTNALSWLHWQDY